MFDLILILTALIICMAVWVGYRCSDAADVSRTDRTISD